MNEHIVFVVYDCIENSVFYGQVLTPLIRKKNSNSACFITIITFEKVQPNDTLVQLIQEYNITLIIHKRFPFLGTGLLYNCTRMLRKDLRERFSQTSYTLIARGPQAAWICMQAAIDHEACKEIIIQARGLLAEEFAYVQSKKGENGWVQKIFKQWRYKQYKNLENNVYQHIDRYRYEKDITLEVVSKTLQEYLVTMYSLSSTHIRLAHADIPEKISLEQKKEWRLQVRNELKIPLDTYIICYNGSAHAWQCPELVIRYFQHLTTERQNSFLLILTQQKNKFIQLLHTYNINPSRYYICAVPHVHIYRFLAACDAGILFREANLINWVSRPTKMLEYEAAHLPIIHNKTVATLIANKAHNTYYLPTCIDK